MFVVPLERKTEGIQTKELKKLNILLNNVD